MVQLGYTSQQSTLDAPLDGPNGRWMADGARGAASFMVVQFNLSARKREGKGGRIIKATPDNPRSVGDFIVVPLPPPLTSSSRVSRVGGHR